jgi:enoyl-[acyl-carrier protein] reductase I
MSQGLLAGKRFLIAGIASKLSIAFGIAAALHREGAELAFTYPNEKLKNVLMTLQHSLVQPRFPL